MGLFSFVWRQIALLSKWRPDLYGRDMMVICRGGAEWLNRKDDTGTAPPGGLMSSVNDKAVTPEVTWESFAGQRRANEGNRLSTSFQALPTVLVNDFFFLMYTQAPSSRSKDSLTIHVCDTHNMTGPWVYYLGLTQDPQSIPLCGSSDTLYPRYVVWGEVSPMVHNFVTKGRDASHFVCMQRGSRKVGHYVPVEGFILISSSSLASVADTALNHHSLTHSLTHSLAHWLIIIVTTSI